MGRRLYLKIGDVVVHREYRSWGRGEVVEEKHSALAGGFCMVRILFEDGKERSFINDLDHQQCCYYLGLRIV
ncbi:MAG: DUF3553 domain-containing protein [Thermodesulfovibrio sp.]|nr:DUF3553 domain-containing protein [Thermodesulfovibrio sp.]